MSKEIYVCALYIVNDYVRNVSIQHNSQPNQNQCTTTQTLKKGT